MTEAITIEKLPGKLRSCQVNRADIMKALNLPSKYDINNYLETLNLTKIMYYVSF